MNLTKELYLEDLTGPVDKFLSFHCLPRPPFGWDQHVPIPFNCQQVPLLHVTVSDALKATGKQKRWIFPRWCGRTSPKHIIIYVGEIRPPWKFTFYFVRMFFVFAENKWRISIHQLLINVWKINSTDFSSTELRNKHQLTVCRSL